MQKDKTHRVDTAHEGCRDGRVAVFSEILFKERGAALDLVADFVSFFLTLKN